MTKRDDFRAIANENLEIFRAGQYVAINGETQDIQTSLERSIALTVEVDDVQETDPPMSNFRPEISFAAEDTLSGVHRLHAEGFENIAVLNFASARSPGGGFLRGANAQEESICRATTLFAALRQQSNFYDRNKAWPNSLYSDVVLYSPKVVVFRDIYGNCIPECFTIGVISAPAPNRKALADAGDLPRLLPKLDAALAWRVDLILEAARRHNRQNLILGAWGCGVFGNSPKQVAQAFAHALAKDSARQFQRVHFAIPHDETNDIGHQFKKKFNLTQ